MSTVERIRLIRRILMGVWALVDLVIVAICLLD